VINPETLVDLMVDRLRTIPEITSVYNDTALISAYHHDFAEHTQWVRELMKGEAGMRVRWAGTGPSNGRPFVHNFEIAVRVGSQDTESKAVYQVWYGFVNGKPGGIDNCCERNWVTPLSNDVLPISPPPTMRPVTDQNGQDYWLISYSIPEKGDTC
jgi:hypothetical protein